MAVSLTVPRMGATPSWPMRLAGWLLAVAALATALLWLGPGLLDWGRFRGTIAAFAAAELGRPVRIDGRISLALLPAPVITAAGVRLDDSGDGLSVSAPALRLRLAFLPLLAGRVVPRELVLSAPSIGLPWPLPPRALAAERPDWLAESSARIEHGTLSVGALRLTDLNADFNAGPTGAAATSLATAGVAPLGASQLTVSGTAHGLGQLWLFSDRLGAPDAAGDAPIEAELDAQAQAGAPAPEAGGRFVGTLTASGMLSGRLALHAADLSRLLPAPPVAARADGSVALGSGPAQARLALVIGGVPATAELHARPAAQTVLSPDASTGGAPPQVLALTIGRLDLDGWSAALARGRHGAARMIALPWPVSLDVAVDAIQLRGGLIRAVHAALDVDGGRGVLHNAAAILPGDASLALAGTLSEGADGLSLAGSATLDAPQLRRTLDWLRDCGLRLGDALPPDVLRTARLTGEVQANSGQVALNHLGGSIEQARLRDGRLAVDTTTGAIDAALSLDHLAAENWLTVDPAAPHGWPAISRRLSGSDVALRLQAADATLHGRTLANLDLDAATDAGGLAVNGLGFDLDGLHFALSGTIAGDGQVSDGRLDVTGASAAGIKAWLPPILPRASAQLWAGPITLHAEAVGPQDALIASLSVDLADARLEAHPIFDLATGAWSAQMTLRHPGAPRLLADLGMNRARDWLGEGSLSLLAQLSGSAGVLRADSFDLTAATLHATGALSLAAGAGTPVLSGHLAADTLPLPAFDPHATTPMTLDLLHGWNAALALTAARVTVGETELLTDARATLRLDAGALTLADAHATLAGGALAGRLVLATAATPPALSMQATLTAATATQGILATPFDIATGTLAGSIDLSADGYSPAALTASLAGNVALDAAAGSLTGIDLAAAHRAGPPGPALTQALAGGATRFDHLALRARVANGVAQVDALALDGPDGVAKASGTLDLAAATMNLLAELPDQLSLRLTGPIAAPKRLPEPARL